MRGPNPSGGDDLDGDLPFLPEEMVGTWRGDRHLESWPESMAGPEDWLLWNEIQGEEETEQTEETEE